jgi:putative ABC transport system permease protein
MIKNYFKIAIRSFKRNKLFTLINIIGLSIGICTALVIYLIVSYDFSFDRFHKDGDRIYRVVTDFSSSGETGHNGGVTWPLGEAVKTDVTGLESTAPFYTLNFSATVPNGTKAPAKFKNESNIVLADGRYFAVFPYKWLAGSARTSLNGPDELVLTSDQAKNYFPSLSYEQMLGKQVVYEDTLKMTVTGIVQKVKENTDFAFKDFISISTINAEKSLRDQITPNWGNTNSASQLFVKLLPQTTPADVQKQLNALLKKYNPQKEKGNTQAFRLQKLSELHFDEKYGNFDMNNTASKTTLYGLLVIAAFILALGCINFINLSTAQASQRAKEIGIRKTMGSSRLQLIGQFLSETFLVTLLAVIISVFLVPVVLKAFSDFIAKDIKFDLPGHPGMIVFIALLTISVSLVAGFYPALVLSNYKPVLVLKNQAYSGTHKSRNALLRKSLTVTQFIIAQFFIMATLLVSKQIYYVLHKDLGFKKDAILVVTTPYKNNSESKKQVFAQQLRLIPQIGMISIGWTEPSSGSVMAQTTVYKDGKKEIKTDLQVKQGDENYISVYHIKLLAGRNLRTGDTTGQTLINEKYARTLGFKDPKEAIGKYLGDDPRWRRVIIGVVGDFYQYSLHTPIKPLCIEYHGSKNNNGTFHIALKSQTVNGQEWKRAIENIKSSWKKLYPDDDFNYSFFDESIAKFYEREQHMSKLLTWATGISILISCLGLLGLAMFTTNLRTKEIGVRKVLGATVTQIVTLLSTELVMLVLRIFNSYSGGLVGHEQMDAGLRR